MPLVLVIDDDRLTRRMIRQTLENAGHAVIEAADGLAGFRIAGKRRPAVVITDIVMPDWDGISTIRALRATPLDVKILAISGRGGSGGASYLRMARKLGADEVLAKPFSDDALLSVLGRLLAAQPDGQVLAPHDTALAG